ncbi:MAG TPA: hypothetical protein VGN83_00355 [Falsiroseomonas sp.]|nr:hypothetical protein [Falsiroseomonas sp.]
MPVRFDIDVPDDDAARLAALAALQGTTPERLLAGWLVDFFAGDPELVNARVAHLLSSEDLSDVAVPDRASNSVASRHNRLP